MRSAAWMTPMLGFFGTVVVVSVIGGPLLVALILGALAAALARPIRRDPPWTRAGRRVWRERSRAWVLRSRWLLRLLRPGAEQTGIDPRHARSVAQFDAVLRVRCELVGDRFQVWHADGAGRAFQVLPSDAPPGSMIGDEGWLHVEGGRARVRPLAPRVLN